MERNNDKVTLEDVSWVVRQSSRVQEIVDVIRKRRLIFQAHSRQANGTVFSTCAIEMDQEFALIEQEILKLFL
jgi:hypothetical protein